MGRIRFDRQDLCSPRTGQRVPQAGKSTATRATSPDVRAAIPPAGVPGKRMCALALPLDLAARLAALALRFGESPGLQQLPNLDVADLGDLLDGLQPDSDAPAGFDVLKVPRRQTCLLRGRLLAPAPCQPNAADVGAKGGDCFHPSILGSCCLGKHAT